MTIDHPFTSAAWLPRTLRYSPDIELLPGTIALNIARFDPDASDADIIDAAKRAQVHDLIQTLPDGYSTMIGPQGLTLSGGQRQRIGLARAFFGQPCLLVLDEPNAHLDDAGEKALERAIDMAHEAGTTVLIVTQRKAIVQGRPAPGPQRRGGRRLRLAVRCPAAPRFQIQSRDRSGAKSYISPIIEGRDGNRVDCSSNRSQQGSNGNAG